MAAKRPSPPGYDPEASRCRECRFGYVPELASDRRLHRRYHDEWQNGVRLPELASDMIVASEGDTDFLLLTPASPRAQKRRGAKVAINARRDTPFDFPSYDGSEDDDQMNTHAIIARRGQRGVGFIVLRRVDRVWRFTWMDYAAQRRAPEVSEPHGRWSVEFVWVRRDLRGQRLASRLVELSAKVLGTTPSEFAWQAPLEPPIAHLAQRLCPDAVRFS